MEEMRKCTRERLIEDFADPIALRLAIGLSEAGKERASSCNTR